MSRRRRLIGGGLTIRSDLELWLDAADASTITESSGSVSQWNDKSGNGNNVTQGTGANQPTTNSRTIGGRNALAFDGSLSFMELPTLSLTGEFTIFFVGLSDTTTQIEIWLGNSAATNKIGETATTDDQFIRIINGGSSDTTQTSPTAGTAFYTTIQRDSSDKIDQAYNGGAFNRLFSDAAQSGTSAFNRIGTDGSNEWDGLMGEIIIYNRALSTAERTAVENYISNKWGI